MCVFAARPVGCAIDLTRRTMTRTRRADAAPWNVLGLPYNEIAVTYTAGLAAIGDDSEDGMRADCAECTVNMPALNASKTKIDTMQMQYFSSSLVDETVQEWLRPYVRAGVGVSDERYCAAQSSGSAADDVGRCPVAKHGRNNAALLRVSGHECGYQHVRVRAGGNDLADVVVSPVVMRKLRPTWQNGGESKWELLVSATGVEQQVSALNLASAQSLFNHDADGYRGGTGLPDRGDCFKRSFRTGLSLPAAVAGSTATGGFKDSYQRSVVSHLLKRLMGVKY